MNKSSITNITSAGIIAAGYLVAAKFNLIIGAHIKTIGFFALSGAITNWIAIYMLFDKVPGLYGSGVIPAHFEEIKNWIQGLVMEQFFTKDNLDKYFAEGQEMLLDSFNFDAAVEQLDYDRIYDTVKVEVLSTRLGGMLSMFGGDNMLEKYREKFKVRIKEYILVEIRSPGFFRTVLSSGDFDVSSIVIDKVSKIVQARLDELTPVMVKEIVRDMIRKHLGWLVVWGGVFGGLIGLVMSFVK